MKRSTLRTSTALSALGLTIALTVSGCSGAPDSADKSAGGTALKVVATTTQVGDFTQNVGGDLIDLTQLLAPGASAHHFDPTPADLAALREADVLVINGAGLEEFLDSAIEASGFAGKTIDTSSGIELSSDGDHDHDHAHDEPAGDAHAEELGNPHIWTDPKNAQQMTKNIEKGLAAADPSHASEFATKARAYQQKLDTLDDWITTNVDQVEPAKRLVVSNHDAFHYFLQAYGITFVGAIIPSFEDNAEPSAKEIDALVAKITELGVTAIFSESSISDKTATSIASAAGVTVYSGDNALFSDSLGAKGSGGETYLSSTVHNTTMILKSWKITPSTVPAGLE